MGKENSKIYYLDDDNNIVDKEVATHAIIREFDDNNNFVGETYMFMKKDNQEEEEEIELSEGAKAFIESFGLNTSSNKK